MKKLETRLHTIEYNIKQLDAAWDKALANHRIEVAEKIALKLKELQTTRWCIIKFFDETYSLVR